MSRFFEPNLTTKPDSPFVRDASSKLVRRSYWMDMPEEAGLVLDRLGVLSFHRSWDLRQSLWSDHHQGANEKYEIIEAISVGYYEKSNRGTYATTV